MKVIVFEFGYGEVNSFLIGKLGVILMRWKCKSKDFKEGKYRIYIWGEENSFVF